MTEIDDILGSYSKEQLHMMLDYLGAPMRENAPKKTLVTRLSSYLKNAPSVWMGMLPENDLRLLQRLVDAGPDKGILLLRPDYPTLVEAVGIVLNDRDEDYDTVEVKLPKAMFDIVAPHIRRVIAAKENDGSFEIEHLVMGFMNIFGVLPVKTFVNLVFDRIESEQEAMELSARIAECPLIRLYQEEYNGDYYVASPFVDDVKEIMEIRRDNFKTIRKYAKDVTWEQAMSAGVGTPFCAYGMDTPEGIALKEMLEDLGFSGDELQEALHTAWMDSQYAIDDEATETLFSLVTDHQDEIGSFELFRQCIETLVAYSNIVPKWFLKGFNSNDADMMRITVRADELLHEYNNDEPGLNLYKMGLAVKPVDPEAPCPCGSGLSYRFCHGKILN